MKYTDKELYDLSRDELIYPENKDELRKEFDNFFLSQGFEKDDDYDFFKNEKISELVPIEFWFNACEKVNELAEMLLELKEEKFDSIRSSLRDIEISIEEIRNSLDKKE